MVPNLKQGYDQTTLSLIRVICSFEPDDARPRSDSDQPTLSLAPDPSNPRVLILETVICPFEPDGAKSETRLRSNDAKPYKSDLLIRTR
ncbi:hypothetical protein GQ457_10G012600 [Hibiscus cannabinus]